MSYNKKIWVSDLSEKALTTLKEVHSKQLKKEGYSEEEIKEYTKDIETAKLTSVEDIIGKQLLRKLVKIE